MSGVNDYRMALTVETDPNELPNGNYIVAGALGPQSVEAHVMEGTTLPQLWEMLEKHILEATAATSNSNSNGVTTFPDKNTAVVTFSMGPNRIIITAVVRVLKISLKGGALDDQFKLQSTDAYIVSVSNAASRAQYPWPCCIVC
jgi:hypothetical protein